MRCASREFRRPKIGEPSKLNRARRAGELGTCNFLEERRHVFRWPLRRCDLPWIANMDGTKFAAIFMKLETPTGNFYFPEKVPGTAWVFVKPARKKWRAKENRIAKF